MNNIEMDKLRNDLKKYLDFTDEDVDGIWKFPDVKLISLKKEIQKIEERQEKTTKNKHAINLAENKIKNILVKKSQNKEKKVFVENFKATPKVILKEKIEENINQKNSEIKKVKTNPSKKPKILFISDVKGWAWWIKSHYIKKYLGDKFDISVAYVVGDGCTPYNNINQKAYDLYFTWGFSYIDFLHKVPKHKKVTGITAHRRKSVIQPKMKLASWHHANSIMLLKEMHEMGFKNTFYVPNGVDEKLFKPINAVGGRKELIVGHVGKECVDKGQKEILFPAMKKAGLRSYTNTKNWKNKIPHDQMINEYNQMDLFLCSSVEDGTPNPALEAAACGRPIISNKIGNMPELVVNGHNGFLVPKKVDAYVEKMNYFKNNRNELIRMGRNARETIERDWRWDLMAKNYLRMFDTIFDIKRDKAEYQNIALKHLEKM